MAQLCPLSTALRQLETLFHFLQLVAGVEHYQLKFRSQAAVIDEIVDTTFEVNQAGPGRSQVERMGHWKARLQVLVPRSGPSEKSVGLPEAEAGAITSHPFPTGWRRGLQEVTPREAAWVQTSASGWLSTNSGQVPISAGKITGPAGVGGRRPTEF